jgi:competence protein ComEC
MDVPNLAAWPAVRAVAAIPAGGLLAGCAVGLFWPGIPHPLLYSLLIVLGVGSVLAFRAAHVPALAVLVAAGFGVGAVLLASSAWERAWRPSLRVAFETLARAERREAERRGRRLPLDDTATVGVTGVLRQDASLGAAGASLSLDVTGIVADGVESLVADGRHEARHQDVSGGVILTVSGALSSERLLAWRRGRRVATTATLKRASRYLDPGVADLERALARRGTTLVGSVKSGALVEVLARGSPIGEAAASVRAFARTAIAHAVGPWSGRSAAIVTAIVIGDRTGLDQEVQRRLQDAGTYHVIAISGGNIAILAAAMLAAFRIVGFLGRGAMVCAAVGMGAYGYVVGGGASVDRATLMAMIYFAGRAFDLRGPPLNTLALVAGILVIVDPLAVSDPAFLLTFGATTAILLVMPLVVVQQTHRLFVPAITVFAATAAAEAALMPVAAAFFSRVTFAGLLLNFVALPLMAMAQIAGMTVLPLFALSATAASAAGWVAHIGAEGLIRSADLVEWTPAVAWRVAAPPFAAVLAYYAGLAAAWWTWRWRTEIGFTASRLPIRTIERTAVVVAGVGALWILVGPPKALIGRGDGRLHVTFIDVGQGDSALLQFPGGSSFVVDAGGLGGRSSFDIGDRVVGAVMRQAGVRRLDTLVLTHGDADHIGGAPAIVRDFRPWDLWEGIPVPPFEPLEILHDEAARRRIRQSTVQTGDAAMVDGVSIVVRHPGLPDWERQEVRNDDSVVIELLWRDVSIVLTGDIGREVEQAILPQFVPSTLRVIKVPHHGSLSSSGEAFVRALSPRVAVASAGRSNTFGHPAPAVLRRYQDVGADVFRTDQDGAVTVDTDGTSLEVRTFTGRRSLIVRKK